MAHDLVTILQRPGGPKILVVGDVILDRTRDRARTEISKLIQLDDGEACDYRAPGASCCCSVTCQLQPAQTVCNDGAFCSAVDRCTAQGACVGGDATPCPGPDGDGDCTEQWVSAGRI